MASASTVSLRDDPSAHAHCAPGILVVGDDGRSTHHAQGDPHPRGGGRPGSSWWEKIIAFDALHAAYLRARRGKRYQADVLAFSANLETELVTLHNELRWRTYRTSPYRSFEVFDPKRRQILAPAFRDRVVHHALCAVVEPLCERRFIHDSYACRAGKGTHAAMRRLQTFLRRATSRGHQAWALKADVSRYFPSIPHGALLRRLWAIVPDSDAHWLFREILASTALSGPGEPPRGLPIGALTSQLFANVYLDQVDHAIKEDWGEPWYLRYMDDLVVVDRDRLHLRRAWRDLADTFAQHGLAMNPKTTIFAAHAGVPFVGYRVWADRVRVLQASLRRFRRHLRTFAHALRRGAMTWAEVLMRIRSWLAHAAHADSWRVRERLLGDMVFHFAPA